MRKLIVIGCLIAAFNFSCKSQDNKIEMAHETIKANDSLRISKRLIEYKSNCLDKLFASIIQSNEHNYSLNEYFYSVTFSKNAKSKRIIIEPQKWASSNNIDYKGVIKYIKGLLLLRGNFEGDSTFQMLSTEFQIKLTKNDKEDSNYIQEPVLQGFLLDCKSLPIYIEIYAGDNISGFTMKQQGESIIIKKLK